MRVGPGGHVLEPASGAFDVTVAPGEDVQAAVGRCPPGGCVLLLPGTHDGPLVLGPQKEKTEVWKEEEGGGGGEGGEVEVGIEEEGEGVEDDGGGGSVAPSTFDKVVHVFGRGRAALRAVSDAVVSSDAAASTLDGLVIRREAGGVVCLGAWIKGGALRMQACDVTCASGHCVWIEGGADPRLVSCL